MASGLTVRAEDLWFEYLRGEPVIKGVTLEARPGEIVAIMGSTGCGKSTLLMLLAGLLPPSSGHIYYDGKAVEEMMPSLRRRIGVLFQNPDDQFFNPTVYEEIAYSLRGLGTDPGEVEQIVTSVAETFGIDGILDRPPFKLSVGEKKMVALASIISYGPDVLMLDEPTANLDRRNVERVENLLHEAKEDGKTVVMASHDLEFVASHADRVYMMDGGRIVGEYFGWDVLRPEVARGTNLKLPLLIKVVERLKITHSELVDLLRG